MLPRADRALLNADALISTSAAWVPGQCLASGRKSRTTKRVERCSPLGARCVMSPRSFSGHCCAASRCLSRCTADAERLQRPTCCVGKRSRWALLPVASTKRACLAQALRTPMAGRHKRSGQSGTFGCRIRRTGSAGGTGRVQMCVAHGGYLDVCITSLLGCCGAEQAARGPVPVLHQVDAASGAVWDDEMQAVQLYSCSVGLLWMVVQHWARQTLKPQQAPEVAEYTAQTRAPI